MNSADKKIDIRHSQNELKNTGLLQKLVEQSSISKGDLVYDIGAGSGAITSALLKKGARVIAIEKDEALYLKLKQKIIEPYRLELHHADFLDWQFPAVQIYKVFSSIPFFHTADIIDKLLFGSHSPEDCYLIIQKEAAEKFAGTPEETLASLLIKPLFWVDIIYHFNRHDFRPVPSVDITLLQFEKRKCCLVPERHYRLYKDFIVYCREGSFRTVKKMLNSLFSYPQLKQLSRLLYIEYRCNPAELNFMQYLSIFQFYLDHCTKNLSPIKGAGERMKQLHSHRIISHRNGKL